MHLWTDSRAQSIQVGAVLLFGILIVMLALYQAFVVPDQNEEIEFTHNQEVQQQLTDLRSAAISMPGETTRTAVSVDLGVRYPSRTVFVNPGPASGTVQTVNPTGGNGTVTISNAGVVGEDRGVASFWNATDPVYGTKAIEYRPNYNLYLGAPRTAYEHGTLYNEFDNGATLPVTDQALVDGNRITFVAINGSLRENRVDSASVAFEPVSTRTRSVWVSGQGGENITLELPSRLSNDGWNETLAGEPNAWVVENGNDDVVEIELADDVYELQLAKVGVGTRISGTDPAYVAIVEGHQGTIVEGQTHPVTVEVRDKYNGPMRGVTVEATAADGAIENPETQTDRNGQATFEFNSTDVFVPGDEREVELTFEADESEFLEDGSATVTTTVTVQAAADGEFPDPAFDAFWTVPEFGDEFDTDCEADVDVCIEAGTNAAEMAFETNPDTAAGFVDFAVDNRSVGQLDSYSGEFDDGATEFDVRFDAVEAGLTNVTLFTGGSRDTVEVEVVAVEGFEVTITDTNEPVTEGETLTVTADVRNTGNETDAQDIVLELDGGVGIVDTEEDFEVAGGDTESVTLAWETEASDAGEYTATVSSDDDFDSASVRVEGGPLVYRADLRAGGPEPGDDTGVEFSVENVGTQTLEVTGITIIEQEDSTELRTGAQNCEGALQEDKWDAEVYVVTEGPEASDGCAAQAQGWDHGELIDLTVGNNDPAVIESGEQAEFFLYEFLDGNTPVSMGGTDLVLEIQYEDEAGVTNTLRIDDTVREPEA